MYYVGIDPGKAGAMVIINQAINEGGYYDTPILKEHPTGYNINKMCGMMNHTIKTYKEVKFCIESLIYMPGKKNAQGLKSAGSSGVGWGIWWGLMHAFQVEIMPPVHPRTWQSQLFKNIPKEVTGKQRAVHVCKEMGDPIPLKKSERQNAKLMDGRADAFCIALWAMLADRKNMNESGSVSKKQDAKQKEGLIKLQDDA